MSTQINPDLVKERKAGTFNPIELTYIIDGGRNKTLRRQYLEHIILTDPVFDGPDSRFLSRKEEFLEALRKHVALITKSKELNLQTQEEGMILNNAALTGGAGPLAMHMVAFIPPIRLMGDEEQKAKWLPLAEKFEIIGCYAQTELGHGSFVRGIETTAVYDPKTKEFVLNSPTISSSKWWVGTLGLGATHAVLMAQLESNGKRHGLHPFIVQLRDMKTRKPLPDVSLGDIGPKMGSNTMDNGFLRLNNIRIPNDQLLSKAGKVLDDGTYVKPQSAKLVYGGMLGIRASLPRMAAYNIAKAAVIAIRYSCVRRQSEIKPGEPEPQVLDFQTQQHKLFPHLANSYAFTFVAQWLTEFYKGVSEEMHQGNFDRLPEIHVLAAGLKAVCNWKAHEGVELCRLSCGGHGYSKASGLPDIYVAQVAISTAEGETVVLLLQTGKYLGKCFMDLQQGKNLDPSAVYLGQKYSDSMNLSGGINSLVTAMQFRSLKCLEMVGSRLQKVMMETGDQNAALNANSVLLVEAAKAHIEAVIINAFVIKVNEISKTRPDIAKSLSNLCEIYGITEILAHAGDYVQHGYLQRDDVGKLQDRLFDMYRRVRPEAITLTDAFDFGDKILNSILGRWDGQVYDNLYKWARDSPLNQDEVHESYDKYIKGLKQAKL